MNTVVNTPIRFVYANTKNGRKATVAYTYDDANNQINVSVAECSKRDRFCKAIGRNVAVGRLAHRGGKQVPYAAIGSTRYRDIAAYIVNNIDNLTY